MRRAIYDAMPIPYFVATSRELFVVATRDRVIGRDIFLTGEFDFCKLQSALSALARETGQVPSHLIDVGANIGSITIPALARGLVKTASAIEPHPENARLLRANLALNGLENQVVVYERAAAELSGCALMLVESTDNSGNHSIGKSGIKVSGVRLDDLNLPTANSLLWMDIEGYEGNALAGAVNILAAGTPLVSEFNPNFLLQSGGLGMFEQAMKGRRIFDLSSPGFKESTIAELISIYANSFTDILAISKRET